MRRCLLALALSVLALGAQPAAAAPPKQPDPLELSGIADVLEAEAPPVETTGTNESDAGSDVEPVANDPASSPPQQAGDEAPPAETEQQSEPKPAAAQPNDSSSDEVVVAPAADPSAPQAEVTGGTELQQAAEPEAVPANNAEPQQAAEPEAVPADNPETGGSASPAPASQSAAAGHSAERPDATKAPATKRVRQLQVWDADLGGEPSATVAAPPAAVGDTAAGVITAPLREPDLVPPHAGGLPTLLPVELISEIPLEELASGLIGESEASRPAASGVAAVGVVRRERPAAEADRPKAAAQRSTRTEPRSDQSKQDVPKTAPTPTDLKSAPTARRGPDFIVAAQRTPPGTAMNPDRPPWLITLLALLATAVSLAAITIIVLRPHLFGGKSVPPAPRPQEPENTRSEQAGIRYRE